MNWNGEMHRFTSPIWCLAIVAMAAVGAFAVAGGALAAPAAPRGDAISVSIGDSRCQRGNAHYLGELNGGSASGTPTTTATPIPNVPTPPPGPLQPTDRLITSLDMSGADEVPPVTTTAIGSFRATLTGSTLCYTFGADGSGLTMAHLYHGAAGTNGDPVVQLFMNGSGVNEIVTSGCISAVNIGGSLAGNWSAFMQALDSGDLYVQVRSLAHPDGEIRGQLFHSPGQGRCCAPGRSPRKRLAGRNARRPGRARPGLWPGGCERHIGRLAARRRNAADCHRWCARRLGRPSTHGSLSPAVSSVAKLDV